MTARDWLARVSALGLRVSLSEVHGVRMRYREWDALPTALIIFALDHEAAIADALRRPPTTGLHAVIDHLLATR